MIFYLYLAFFFVKSCFAIATYIVVVKFWYITLAFLTLLQILGLKLGFKNLRRDKSISLDEIERIRL